MVAKSATRRHFVTVKKPIASISDIFLLDVCIIKSEVRVSCTYQNLNDLTELQIENYAKVYD
jgi:hypothetical protein